VTFIVCVLCILLLIWTTRPSVLPSVAKQPVSVSSFHRPWCVVDTINRISCALQYSLAHFALQAVHNVPEGLAVSLSLVAKGTSAWEAALWSIFSSLPQVIVAIPAFLFVEKVVTVVSIGLGFAAGAMLFVTFNVSCGNSRRNFAGYLLTVCFVCRNCFERRLMISDPKQSWLVWQLPPVY